MFPAANVSSAVAKPVQAAQTQTAQKTSQPQAPETARTSSGESAAANIKAETAQAIQAPDQSSVAPRLRDQETAESTDRSTLDDTKPAGPPPTFEETPLERQARVALDPAEILGESPEQSAPPETFSGKTEGQHNNVPDDVPEIGPEKTSDNAPALADPPPTPTEKAEASFSETRAIADPQSDATIDVAR